MIASKLSQIAAEILRLNPYFDAGYSNVLATEEGHVITDEKNNQRPVFPNDTLGDYFYLRMPRAWGFDYSNYIAEGVSGVNITGVVVLVAYVLNADPDKLAANLVNTLRVIGERLKGTIQLQAATAIADEVIAQELADLSEDQIEAALARRGENITLCSVTFTYTQMFPLSTCFDNPCISC